MTQEITMATKTFNILPALLITAAAGLMGCGPVEEIDPVTRPLGPAMMAAAELEGETPEDYPEVNEPCRGYTLFGTTVEAQYKGQVTLIDMAGQNVRTWEGLNGFPAKMLPGGSIMATKGMRPGLITSWQDSIELVQVDWDGKTEWSFKSWDNDKSETMMSRQHHDYQREGSPTGYYAPGQEPALKGKTLVLAHKERVVPNVSRLPIDDDVLYEVTADGKLTDFVWYSGDHIDEMGFSEEERLAIYDNPMFNDDRLNGDWLHINSASTLGRNRWYEKLGDERFHPDNIIISSREAGFVAIISRETGKIVWRVGPDFSEGTPWHELGMFVGQHHVHMIPHGLPGAGNILVFDNGGASGYGGSMGHHKNGRAYSRVLEFNPVTFKKVWEYGGSFTSKQNFFSGYISSAQRLPNGNTLITEGDVGRMFEVTWRGKKKVWEHYSQVVYEDGSKHIYRGYRVPPEWLPTGINPGRYPSWKDLYEGGK